MSISILCAMYLDPITGGIVEPCLHNLIDWAFACYFNS